MGWKDLSAVLKGLIVGIIVYILVLVLYSIAYFSDETVLGLQEYWEFILYTAPYTILLFIFMFILIKFFITKNFWHWLRGLLLGLYISIFTFIYSLFIIMILESKGGTGFGGAVLFYMSLFTIPILTIIGLVVGLLVGFIIKIKTKN